MSRFPLEQMIASLRPVCSSSSKLGTIAGLLWVSVIAVAPLSIAKDSGSSHAAVWLGQSGDVGHLLRRLLGEQDELLLNRDAADGLDAPRGGGLALGLVVLAQE